MSNKTRILLLAGVAVLVLAVVLIQMGGGGDSTDEAEKQVWNYSIWGPPRAFTSGIEYLKQEWEAAGQGRFELNIGYGGALSPPKEHLDSIKIGLIEAARVCVGYAPGKTPLAQVLELPLILTADTATNARIVDAVLQHPAVEEELARRWNAKYLMVGVLPAYEFMGNTRLGGVEDMAGVRMRISGANASLLEEFDAVATMVTAPEAYTALERGTIDVIGFPWTDSFGVFRLHEVSQYVTLGMAMGGFACMSAVSLDAWEKFPDDLKAMLPRLREEGIQVYLDANAEGDRKWVPIFEKRLEIVPFPKSERERMVAKAEPLWRAWAKKADDQGIPGSELLEYTLEQVAKFAPAQ